MTHTTLRLTLLCVVTPFALDAQQPVLGGSRATAPFGGDLRAAGTTRAPGALRGEAAPPELYRLPAFVAQAAPGNIAVMRVPVPAALRAGSPRQMTGVSYRITNGSAARVVGASSGFVANDETAARVTLNMLRASEAGRRHAATVEFFDVAGNSYAVPIEVDVAVARNLQLLVPDSYVGAARGAWTALRYEIRNAGNSTEQVALTTVVPQGWRTVSDDLRGTVSMAPGASRIGAVRLWVPQQFSMGQSQVRLVLTTAGATIAAADVSVDVRDAHGGSSRGPQLALSVVGATAADGSLATGYMASVDGAIADSVFIAARMSMTNASGGAATYGLSRSGVGNGPPSLSLMSRHLDLSVGAISVQQSELSGFFVNGVGASTAVKAGQWSAGGFASRPFSGANGNFFSAGAGRFAGAEVSRRSGWGTMQLQGVSLRDGQIDRSLDAVSLSSSIADVAGGELSSEVGYRSSAAGSGAGVAGNYRRSMNGSLLNLRVMHAPGGSRAFARAVNDIEGSLSQRLGDVATVSGGAWRQQDDNAALGRLQNTGWFLNPMLNVKSLNTAIGLEARGQYFASSGSGASFVNDEEQVAGVLDAHYRAAYTSVRVGYGRVQRSVALPDAAVPDATGRRLETRVASGLTTSNGRFEALYLSQQFAGVPGLFPEQQSISARADQVRLPFLAAVPLYANADAQRFVSGNSGTDNWSARGGLTATLPGTLGNVSVQAEYNPYIVTGGRNAMMYSVRLDRAFGLPRFAPSRDQRLFVDANGNGSHDRGERGVSGIVVECGTVTAVTDADGRFACPAGATVQVDARTVPVGMLAPPIRSAATPRGDIALRPVQSRLVRLVLADVDSARVRLSDLAQAIVIARDSAGTAWVARSRGNGDFTFDALPPGRYELAVDASAISEPLNPGTLPVLIIREGETGAMILIQMKARTIRVKQLGARHSPASQLPASVGGGTDSHQRSQQ